MSFVQKKTIHVCVNDGEDTESSRDWMQEWMEKVSLPRMRGGGGETYRYADMVNKAIASAWRQNKIELEHGRPNAADGNCAFESIIFNIQDREIYKEKVDMNAMEARQVWVTELQTAIETDYPHVIPDNIPGFNATQSWDKLKEEGVYEIELMGDLMLHAISRGSKKVILIFNTSPEAHGPIYVVTPEHYGGVRDSEIPVCVAYNQFHYESLHPKSANDVILTQELVYQYTAVPSIYKYGKKDIADLIKPLKRVPSVPLVEVSSQLSREDSTKRKKPAKTDAERKREYRSRNPDKYAEEKKNNKTAENKQSCKPC